MENIVFTRNCGNELESCLSQVKSEDLYLLTDENSQRYCTDLLKLDDIPVHHRIVIPSGEKHKTLEYVMKVWQLLSDTMARRTALLVNLGGGVVTDLGGFAASCFKRGISCINVPTTLLSQIDASVGGKTGVDFNGYKNEIGTFNKPGHVFIDNRFLATLPYRQVLSGFSEMLKHALLSQRKNWDNLVSVDLSKVEEEDFLDLIIDSVSVKNAIVQSDFKETGLRKALNFGHTIGHAIESVAVSENIEIYHGDAVAYGMIAELYLSVQKLGFDKKMYAEIRRFIHEKFPEYTAVASSDRLYELMLHDKKNSHQGVNFTLLHDIGEFETDHYCSYDDILEALAQI